MEEFSTLKKHIPYLTPKVYLLTGLWGFGYLWTFWVQLLFIVSVDQKKCLILNSSCVLNIRTGDIGQHSVTPAQQSRAANFTLKQVSHHPLHPTCGAVNI